MAADLRQQARSVRASGIAEKYGLKAQAAADRFLDHADAFHGQVAFRRRLTLAERFTQIFDQRILAAGNAAQAGIRLMYHQADHNPSPTVDINPGNKKLRAYVLQSVLLALGCFLSSVMNYFAKPPVTFFFMVALLCCWLYPCGNAVYQF